MGTFHFLRPYWLLALLPLAVLFWHLLRAPSGPGAWRNVCAPHLLAHLLVGPARRPSCLPWLLLGLGWLLAVLALAGPAWKRLPAPLFQAQIARVLVLDLSESMNATDVEPSRLVRARYKLLDLLAQTHEGQIGLVVYAGESFVVAPLTHDAADGRRPGATAQSRAHAGTGQPCRPGAAPRRSPAAAGGHHARRRAVGE